VPKSDLTQNEKKVLYGFIANPELNDSELSNKINVKLSTLTSIKRRLIDKKIFRKLTVPLLNNLGCELLAIIYTQFNPVIPLDERVKKTKESIEVFDEIFFSTGEQEKGFSVSLSKNYSNIGRINDIRTEIFGSLGLLEKEYPSEVIFPFKYSSIIRFFSFSRSIGSMFNYDIKNTPTDEECFTNIGNISLSEKEKKVYVALIEHPNSTTQQIGDKVGLSRHTISKMKSKFYEQKLMKNIYIPDLQKLGFEMFALYHLKFNPGKPPSSEDIAFLDSPSTVFLARRKFETVIISAYHTYQDYKMDKMNKITYLKENNFISYTPLVRKYVFERMIFIKNFNFAPIARKILKIK